MMPDENEVTRVLNAIGQGDIRASDELLPLVYDELRRLAAARMARESSGHTLQATALVHEAWLRVVGDGRRQWENRGHFFAAAAEAMRRILIENARRKSRLKHGGGQIRVELEGLDISAASPDDQVLLLDEAVQRLKAEDEQKAKIVVMKFFGGMTSKEIAGVLGVTERTVERQWAFARAWLFREMQRQP